MGITGGISKANFIEPNNYYRSYDESGDLGLLLGMKMEFNKQKKKRKSIVLAYQERINKVTTYSGGLAGGTTNNISYHLGYLQLEGRLGFSFLKNPSLYVDFGLDFGFPLKREVIDNRSTYIMPPHDQNNGSSTNTNYREYINMFIFGPFMDVGVEYVIKQEVKLFMELEYGLVFNSGRELYHHFITNMGINLGVVKLLK